MIEQPSYYERHKEERKKYQKRYYTKNREKIRRKNELIAHLEPEKVEKIRAYQRNYYLENRERLLDRKRKAYLARKTGG